MADGGASDHWQAGELPPSGAGVANGGFDNDWQAGELAPGFPVAPSSTSDYSGTGTVSVTHSATGSGFRAASGSGSVSHTSAVSGSGSKGSEDYSGSGSTSHASAATGSGISARASPGSVTHVSAAAGSGTATTQGQLLAPTSDNSPGHWETAPTPGQSLFAQVDEATASDTDYAYAVA